MMNEAVKNQVCLTFKSLSSNVSLARLLVSSLVSEYDLTLAELDEIRVAVSEAVSNAIIHGYQGSPEHVVELNAELDHDLLTVTVIDGGVGIADIPRAMEANYSCDEERMGLGFSFMQAFMDDLEVFSQVDKGTKVVMRKKLTPPAQEEAAAAAE